MHFRFDLWIWDRKVVGAIFWLFVVGPVAVTAAQYPWDGILEFCALPVSAVGFVFHAVYKFVGRRVERLMGQALSAGRRPIPSLVWFDLLQSPGVASIEGDTLHLTRIAGDPLTLRREEIDSFEEGRWFNGSLLIGKRGFMLKTAADQAVGVAVPASAAAALRGFLTKERSQ